MGGDDAPQMIIEGVKLALNALPHVNILLFGDERLMKPIIDQVLVGLEDRVEVHHTEDKVSSDEKPSNALRNGRNSSMRLAINSVRDGNAAGIVSAGNTGALMAMAKFVMKTLPGIDRPAIASTLPTRRGQTVMLDLGANIDCDANNLTQFAVMGEVYARNVLGLKKPTIGLLNVGVEGMKGKDSVKLTAKILQETHLPIEFYGFVEGTDIGAGTVDVIVTDGFTGNVALKTAEGTAGLVIHYLRKALASSPFAILGALIARPALKRLKEKLDPRRYNGAMFLGLNGICVKSHGGTDAFGFFNAIKVAVDMAENNINDDIKHDFAELTAEQHPSDDAILFDVANTSKESPL
jgi:glycerol-3-phosphate acyltransferase PlsX